MQITQCQYSQNLCLKINDQKRSIETGLKLWCDFDLAKVLQKPVPCPSGSWIMEAQLLKNGVKINKIAIVEKSLF